MVIDVNGISKPNDLCIFTHIFNQPFVVVISNSSTTLFVMLKFTCEGLHLKKLVDAIGAGNIVKAGMWKLYHLELNFAIKEKIWYRERKRSSFSISWQVTCSTANDAPLSGGSNNTTLFFHSFWRKADAWSINWSFLCGNSIINNSFDMPKFGVRQRRAEVAES